MSKLWLFFIILFLSQPNVMAAKKILLDSDSKRRDQAALYLPKHLSNMGKIPLVIALHGYKGSDRWIRFQLKLGSLVDQMRFMLLTPNGTKNNKNIRFWNASNYCCDYDKSKVDDVQFIKKLIETIKNRADLGHLDERKIFIMGFSNGGFMAHKLACDLSDDVAGFVSISGTGDLPMKNAQGMVSLKACQHNKAIPMIHIHGVLDDVIHFNGKPKAKKEVGYLGAHAFLQRWAVQNNCAPTPKKMGSENAIFGKGRFDSSKFVWQNCKAPVTFYQVEKAGHFFIFNQDFIQKILTSFFKLK